jgi:hypothetical protein
VSDEASEVAGTHQSTPAEPALDAPPSNVAPSEADLAAEVAYLRDAPVEAIIANHLFVLLQVGALRLAEQPPRLEAASLVIDAVAAILEAGGSRLGEHADLYRRALAELQQAYVRAAGAR